MQACAWWPGAITLSEGGGWGRECPWEVLSPSFVVVASLYRESFRHCCKPIQEKGCKVGIGDLGSEGFGGSFNSGWLTGGWGIFLWGVFSMGQTHVFGGPLVWNPLRVLDIMSVWDLGGIQSFLSTCGGWAPGPLRIPKSEDAQVPCIKWQVFAYNLRTSSRIRYLFIYLYWSIVD